MPRYLVKVNGKPQSLNVDADPPLLYGLRDDLAPKVPKFGCGPSRCGACTVHVDGVATRSCLLPISTRAGKSVTTLEGLGSSSQPRKLQQAFMDEQAAQCGYCISGMIMRSAALLKTNPRHNNTEIKTALAGKHTRV